MMNSSVGHSARSLAPPAALMLDLLPCMVCYLSPDLRFLSANKNYAEWRQTTIGELVGKTIDEVVSRPNLDILKHHLESVECSPFHRTGRLD